MLTFSDSWAMTFPGAKVGVLVMGGVSNPPHHRLLEEYVRSTEVELRQRFAGSQRRDLEALPAAQAYVAHYRRFSKTYHVLLQLESVALKGRPLGGQGALVTAMFAAEVRNLLLTAGQDLDCVRQPLIADVTQTGGCYDGLGGREIAVKPGDMSIRDALGIISSVLYGPDHRTRLTETTRRVLFTVYAPRGVTTEAVSRHLQEIASNVRMVSVNAAVDFLDVCRPGAC